MRTSIAFAVGSILGLLVGAFLAAWMILPDDDQDFGSREWERLDRIPASPRVDL